MSIQPQPWSFFSSTPTHKISGWTKIFSQVLKISRLTFWAIYHPYASLMHSDFWEDTVLAWLGVLARHADVWQISWRYFSHLITLIKISVTWSHWSKFSHLINSTVALLTWSSYWWRIIHAIYPKFAIQSGCSALTRTDLKMTTQLFLGVVALLAWLQARSQLSSLNPVVRPDELRSMYMHVSWVETKYHSKYTPSVADQLKLQFGYPSNGSNLRVYRFCQVDPG